MKITIKNIIKENKDIDPKQRYVNGILNMIRIPYFNFLRVNEVPEELWKDIFYRLFNHEVIISDNKIFDLNGPPRNLLYIEYYNGEWEKREYDSNNNNIYYEKSNGFWVKREYDENNNLLYSENSNGIIRDNRPSNPINENEDIDPKQKFLSLVVDNMVKQSKDNWFPFDSQKMSFTEYCKNVYGLTDDEIDYVYSKYRFLKGWDERDRSLPYLKKLIYSENTNGIIKDNRPINPINENKDIDPKQRYVNGILNMIRRPYMGFLINNEVPEELWKDILTKIFNTNDIDWGINPNPNPDPDFEVRYELIIQDEKGRQLYYEVSDYWEELIYGYHTRLDMDFTWYINSVGSKKVTFVGKHNPVVYSNGPTGYSWSGLSDDIKNNKFFDLNY